MQARVNRVGARKRVMRLVPAARMGTYYIDGRELFGVWVGSDRLGSGDTKGKAWKKAARVLAKRGPS